MTENTETSTGLPPTTAPRPPLRRSTDDRVIGGVAAGLARWLGIDPVIVRVVLVVLAVFGGSGLVLYVIGWLFIPDAGSNHSEADRFIAKGARPGSTTRAVLMAVAAVVGTLGAAWLWWKTRDLRREMRAQMENPPRPTDGYVIEGEVIRDTPTEAPPRQLPR